MASFSLVFAYLFKWFLYRITEFLRHWYVDGFRKISQELINALEVLDRTIALKITLKNLFRPLYQDYTFIGYFFGFFFRFWRLLFGVILYFFVVLIFFAAFLVWAIIPIYILYKGFEGW